MRGMAVPVEADMLRLVLAVSADGRVPWQSSGEPVG
jgi:hypothetical protein